MLALSAPQRTAPGGGCGKSGGVALTPGCQPIAYSARLSHVLTGPHMPPLPVGGGSSPSVGGDGSAGWLLVGATHTGSATWRHVASTDLMQVARQRRRSRRGPSLHWL